MAGKHTLIDLEENCVFKFSFNVLDFSLDHLQCNKMDWMCDLHSHTCSILELKEDTNERNHDQKWTPHTWFT